MNIFQIIGRGLTAIPDAAIMAIRHKDDPEWRFNYFMMQIRILLEVVRDYDEGRQWFGFQDPGFLDTLQGGKRWQIAVHPTPSRESKLALWEEWEHGGLYDKILSGDAGILRNLYLREPNILEWFFNVLTHALSCLDKPGKFNKYNYRVWCWSGLREDGVSWTQD